jgi:hypothetical protein
LAVKTENALALQHFCWMRLPPWPARPKTTPSNHWHHDEERRGLANLKECIFAKSVRFHQYGLQRNRRSMRTSFLRFCPPVRRDENAADRVVREARNVGSARAGGGLNRKEGMWAMPDLRSICGGKNRLSCRPQPALVDRNIARHALLRLMRSAQETTFQKRQRVPA